MEDHLRADDFDPCREVVIFPQLIGNRRQSAPFSLHLWGQVCANGDAFEGCGRGRLIVAMIAIRIRATLTKAILIAMEQPVAIGHPGKTNYDGRGLLRRSLGTGGWGQSMYVDKWNAYDVLLRNVHEVAE